MRIRSNQILQESFPMFERSLSEAVAVEINEIEDLVSKASRRGFAHRALKLLKTRPALRIKITISPSSIALVAFRDLTASTTF